MRLETELDNLGVKYKSGVIGSGKIIECNNNVRVHIYHDCVVLIDNNGYDSLPPNNKSLEYVLGVIKNAEKEYINKTTNNRNGK